MTSPLEHGLALLARARDDLYGVAVPPDVEDFGRLVPFGVVLRYEEVAAGEPPEVDLAWFDAVVTGTIDWATERMNKV